MFDIFAFSQSFGRTPVSMELWNMMASDGVSYFAHCFSILFGMLSGPDALDGLMFLSLFPLLLILFLSVVLSISGLCGFLACYQRFLL